MRLLTLGLVFATLLVAVSAHQGWDDLSCSQLFTKLVHHKIIPNHDRIKEAFCNHEIDGEFLDRLQNIECSSIQLDPASCESMQHYFAEIAARPSSRFKDVWDWRAHHKRLFDHWLLPLTQYHSRYHFFASTESMLLKQLCAVPLVCCFFTCILTARTPLLLIGSMSKPVSTFFSLWHACSPLRTL
jgi:hypothetical protein